MVKIRCGILFRKFIVKYGIVYWEVIHRSSRENPLKKWPKLFERLSPSVTFIQSAMRRAQSIFLESESYYLPKN